MGNLVPISQFNESAEIVAMLNRNFELCKMYLQNIVEIPLIYKTVSQVFSK